MAPRVPYDEAIAIARFDGRGRLYARALDLSATGIHVISADTCPIGTVVRCTLILPGGPRNVRGRVVRETVLARGVGLAISFSNVDPGTAAAIATYMGNRAHQVMPAKLNHPRLSGGRLAKERNIILIASEHEPSASLAFSQRLLGLDDLQNLVVALGTQRRCQHRHDRVALRLCEVAHAQTGPSENSRRKIRPALALRLVFEIKNGLATLSIIERGEEFFRGGGNFSRRLAWRRAALGKTIQPEPNATQGQS